SMCARELWRRSSIQVAAQRQDFSHNFGPCMNTSDKNGGHIAAEEPITPSPRGRGDRNKSHNRSFCTEERHKRRLGDRGEGHGTFEAQPLTVFLGYSLIAWAGVETSVPSYPKRGSSGPGRRTCSKLCPCVLVTHHCSGRGSL